ncbi:MULTISPECIES: hypothetical protein [unclassified Campylobacter]|uniref:hypothetical protein n=1 Tax=unclassified Campylobacter TaxID=2593542 RepID=UPI0022E9AB11|nr:MULTISPECIES: hypothetical protein [unclassified Campylobacter]MDA3048936.1 hypothetical protein [Campylobacter sp. JMF_15 NE4]MDA3050353.1 hypothetical protein [Campylobacter sp. JMF_02 ED1]MDA3054244.1 hypothetical protein [Campylobacter sp. VBCF_07 NA4]MDA3060935.1 hypothetical protein [Campylobacter sp. VBCF_02 NA5]MDA3070448.1 hypothetical protein [Campylobacter sp. VBCF_08 NA3]
MQNLIDNFISGLEAKFWDIHIPYENWGNFLGYDMSNIFAVIVIFAFLYIIWR